MKLRLIQTGGFAGLTRSAEMDVREEEADALLRGLPPPAAQQPSPEVRDAFNHILVIGHRRIPFSPEEAPEEFKPTIERLVAMLKVDTSGR